MSDIPEMMGEMAQAGLTARAVEPAAGQGSAVSTDGHTAEGCCLNCGTRLIGPHCHVCGQRAHVHRTLGAFLHDLVHGVLHFEGKLWRTLPLLAWQPGRLTREYIDGKRASYISPIALFLFTVFVSFALFNAAGGFGDSELKLGAAGPEQIEAGVTQTVDAAISQAQKEIATDKAAGRDTAKREEELAQLLRSRAFLQATPIPLQGDKGDEAGKPAPAPATSDSAQLDTAQNAKAGQWLQQTWEKAKANPKLLLYKLQTNAYKLSWLLIPISVPFVWMLFPFSRRFRIYDHTVFVTYSISFMTMLVVIFSIGAAYDIQALVIGPMIYAAFHLYRSLRGTYSLSRKGALWRTVLLSAGCFAAMTLFVMIMFGMVLSG